MKQRALLMATLPHSGEQIPPEADWLRNLDEITLMGDVDRFVDRLYEPILNDLQIPYIKTVWHRYAADLNRLPEDVDCEAVEGHINPVGTFPRGFHWVYNTNGEKILTKPLSPGVHQKLIDRVYKPFHDEIQQLAHRLLKQGDLFHLDLHSMPSLGTAQHRDPGEYRKQVVVSDSKGRSCCTEFKNAVIEAFEAEGFSVAYNWPYFGGRLTEQYGQPLQRHHVVQVELNRSLYMNEKTKQILPEWTSIRDRLASAMRRIHHESAHQFARV